MAHITGGGLTDNIARVLPEGCMVEIYSDAWEVPPIFRLIQTEGAIDPAEMARVFNLGLGVVLFVAPEHVGLVEEQAAGSMLVGRVAPREGDAQVVIGTGTW
jgi:phosphoribosylformylglycinamidine cyclo-ligase